MKKIPERRCAACNETKPKNELLRIVRAPDGSVCYDESGKMSGRGVYVCRNASCTSRAIKKKRLESSLKCAIPEEVYEKLVSLSGENDDG